MWVTVKSEAVVDSIEAQMPRYASETEDRKTLVTVIRLHDRSNLTDCLFVKVLATQIMERIRFRRVSIGCGVVNSGNERHLPTRTQIVYEGRFHCELKWLVTFSPET